MNILLVTMQYGRSYVQGTERYLATLSAGLRVRGHAVRILAGDPLRVDRPRRLGEPIEGADGLHALPARGWMTVQGAGPPRFVRWLRGWRPDLVHVANPAHVGVGICAACDALGIPFVVTTMDFWWICPKATLLRPDGAVCDGSPGWRECIRCVARCRREAAVRALGHLPPAASGLLLAAFYAKAAPRGMTPADLLRWPGRRRLLAHVLARAGQVIFPSRATREVIQPMFGHHRARLIPYGLSPEWFADPRPRPARERPPEELTIGFAGALLPHKGPHLLLEAVRRLGWTRTRLRLAGPATDENAAYRSRLTRAAEGLNVEFTGAVRASQMPAFLRSLDLLAMTSLWPENLPFVVLEAQAGGVPVVAANLAGVADQIPDPRLLYEPGSVEGLAAALQYAAGHLTSLPAASVLTAEEMTARTLEAYQAARSW